MDSRNPLLCRRFQRPRRCEVRPLNTA